MPSLPPALAPLLSAALTLLLATLPPSALAAAPRRAASQPHAAAASAPARAAAAECRPGEPSFFRDEALTVKLASKLQFSKTLLREKVNVKVTGGAAMLWGGLSSAEAVAAAVRLASQTGGIRCVDNRLKVGPPDAAEPETVQAR